MHAIPRGGAPQKKKNKKTRIFEKKYREKKKQDRDIHFLFQTLFDDEAFRGLDVFQVDAAEGRSHQLDRIAKRIRILSIQLDIDGVHVGKAFEKHGLAFHRRVRP